MLLKNIATALKQQNWSVLFMELLVVIAGLVLAFQVDRWWESRGEHLRERQYISRLAAEVEEDVELIEHGIKLAEVRQMFAEHLIDVAGGTDAIESSPALFLAAAAQAAFTYTPNLVTHAFEELRSTGSMGLIRSTEIKNALYEYYGFHESQRQFQQLNIMIEFRYFELVADVLSPEQYMWVQDHWFVITRDRLAEVYAAEVDLGQANAAIERLRGNPQLIAWLPRTRGLQTEQVLMHRARLFRAKTLLDSLQSYAARLDAAGSG